MHGHTDLSLSSYFLMTVLQNGYYHCINFSNQVYAM